MKIIDVKAPNDYQSHIKSLKGTYEKIVTIFLAGAIDMGSAKDWQAETKKYLENYEGEDETAVILINPRREDWNSDWKQEKQNKQFNEQVTWELDGLDYADIIFLVFTEESKAPITLLELGLHIKDNPLVVCPLEFYRSGNVDIVCDRHKVDLEYKFDDGLKKLIERIKKIEK